MFVPLKDDQPLQVIRFQYVVIALIVLNLLLFLISGPMRGEEALMLTAVGFGVVPSELLDLTRASVHGFDPVVEPVTLLSYMFLHAGWMHLIGNIAFLWVFADNIEDAFGHLGFTLFYLICGIAAALTHTFMTPTSHDPLIGASGAVSGVLAAYLLLYPQARVWILLLLRIPIKIPAWIVLGGWIILQFVSLGMEQPDGQAVALWAHIGGFAAGLLFTLILRSPLMLRR